MSLEIVRLLRSQYVPLYDQWLDIYPNKPSDMTEFDHTFRSRNLYREMSKLYELHYREQNKWFREHGFEPMKECSAWISDDKISFSFRTYEVTQLWLLFDIDGEFSSAIMEDYNYKHIPIKPEHQRLIEVISNNVMDAYELFTSLID